MEQKVIHGVAVHCVIQGTLPIMQVMKNNKTLKVSKNYKYI